MKGHQYWENQSGIYSENSSWIDVVGRERKIINTKLIKNKDKENQRANIVSIIGIVLTIFFGLLSVFPMLS